VVDDRSRVTPPSSVVVVVVELVLEGGFTSTVAGAGVTSTVDGAGVSVVVCLYSKHPIDMKNDANAKLPIKSRVLLIIVFLTLLIGEAYELNQSRFNKRIDRATHRSRGIKSKFVLCALNNARAMLFE
jgi:hypothetical protein